MDAKQFPRSFLEAARYFADPDVCVEFVAAMRWPDGVACPHCSGKRVSFLKSRRIWKCMNRDCHKQFSVKTFSVFEDSPIPLDKWLTAVWLVVNCKNGISSYEIARDLKVTQKTAWFMLHRIREAMESKTFGKMGGNEGGIPKETEVDETFVGGKLRNKSLKRRAEAGTELRNDNKTIVMGILDRETRQIRAKVVPNVKREVLQEEILKQVARRSFVFTDEHYGYHGLKEHGYFHMTVNHVNEYVCGCIHTQGLENFWSLLKRGLKGTYVAVEPFHLQRYVTEQVFRYNNRATKDNPLTDSDRFALAVSQIAGKRLTYAELTGKVQGPSEEPF
jgi:transposase-like protein